MRPAPSTVEVTSTLSGGRSGKLRIDENSLPNIMDTLTNIYSDPELAVIREYPSNAWDSHKRAGQTRPIEVTLPNAFNAVYVVRDFGVGLDEDEIYDIYGLYALSTKRDSDDEIGMLGIGAKSALAYTDQFTLRCVKNGKRIVVIISAADGEGGGDIWTSDPVDTDEPDGVEFSVAVIDPKSFNSKAEEFFRFWKKDDVLIDGEPPKGLQGLWLDDDVVVLDNTEGFRHHLLQGSIVVMGGVPYPIHTDEYRYRHADDELTNNRVVAFVPIGSVDPAPSREAMKDTERTLDTRTVLTTFVRERLHQIRQDALDACDTKYEALHLRASWHTSYHEKVRLNYRGQKIPERLVVKGFRFDGESVYCHVPDPGNWRSRVSAFIANIEHSVNFPIWVVTNFPNKSVHPSHRERFRRLTGFSRGPGRVFFVQSLRDVHNLEWFNQENVHIIQWEDVKAVQLPREQRTQVQKNGPANYTLCAPGRRRTNFAVKEDIPTEEPTFFIKRGEERDYFMVNATEVAEVLGAPVVVLSANRVKKFQRDFPHAQSALQAIADLGKIVAGSLTPVEAGWVRGTFSHWDFRNIDSADVLDPRLQNLLKEIENIDHDKTHLWIQIQRIATYRFRADYRLPADSDLPQDGVAEIQRLMDQATQDYPLARRTHFYDGELLEYINALYTYRNGA